MKTKTRNILSMMLLAAAMLCVAGCTKPDNGGNEGGGDNAGTGGGTPNPNGGGAGCPKVETVTVSDITSNSAKSGGIIIDNGDGRILEQGICWSTSGTPVVDNTHATAAVGETSFTCTMSNLSPSTTYYVCAYAINTAGVGYGDVHNFKTAASGGGGNNSSLPVLTTTEVNHIKHNSARCGGNVTADGGSTVTARGICWSRHSGTTLDDNVIRIGSGLGEFTIIVTDLNPTTTYYVRAYATNSTGTNYGEEFSFTTTETPEPNPPAPTGAVNGLFSVSPTKQVWFSQGNLQYQASTSTWRFATNSYDYVGGTYHYSSSTSYNYGIVAGSNNNNVSPTYSGWIDLFGWATSGWNNGNHYYQPYDWQYWTDNTGRPDGTVGYGYGPTDGMNYDYDLTGAYAQADWGVHNAISNGGNQAGLWRTLTIDEWKYVIGERSASTINGVEDARFACAIIKIGSKECIGIILFPDEYTHPDGVAVPYYINMTNCNFGQNTYTTANWLALQEAGCIFLPQTGVRDKNHDSMYRYYNGFFYWSSSSGNLLNQQNSAFIGYGGYTFSLGWNTSNYHVFSYENYGGVRHYRYWGCAVRLVQDRQ